ncbi:MAG: sugar phosphate isomerase/epimerase family protein [Thermoguttaceae bacterium]
MTLIDSSVVSRRGFLASSAAVTAASVLAGGRTTMSFAAETSTPSPWKTQLVKALITDTVTDGFCETLSQNGYSGMEVSGWNITPEAGYAARIIAEKHGVRVHSVMRGWAEFNHNDTSVAEKTLNETITAIRAASALGADDILLVPCRTGGKTPEAWDIDIKFDPKTLVVSSVVDGDNAPFAEYIAAQNLATERTIRAVEKLIPVAASEGVIIAIENVWNNLWSSPELFAALVNYFATPWVKTYFDLGNHTKYRRCVDWLRVLGPTIAKLHIKDFKVTEPRGKFGGGPGDWAKIGEGTIDWVGVRKTIDEIGYSGYVTIESGGYTPAEHSAILDKFFAGELVSM